MLTDACGGHQVPFGTGRYLEGGHIGEVPQTGAHHSLLEISPRKGNALLGFSRSMWDSQVVISISILDVPCSRRLANGAFVLMRIRGHRSFLFTPHLPPRDFLFFSHLLGNWVGNRKWHVAIGLGADEPLESIVPQFPQWFSNDI